MPRKSRSFRIGRAKTGLGLFATKPIRKRAFIVEYTGKRITSEESEKREARGARYIFELDKKWALDGSTHRNLGRYANHACRPNAESDIVKGKVIIRATRKIEPGQEITYHYGKDYLENVLTRRGCKCPTCTRRRSRQRAEQRLRAERRKKREAAKRKQPRKKAAPKSAPSPRKPAKTGRAAPR